MKKRAKLIAAAVSLGALMTVGGTLAWFTDSETATNTVTTGYVDLAIQENMPTEQDQENNGYTAIKEADGSGIIYSGLTPGAKIQKDPSIFYKGSVDAYVRYRVKSEPTDVDPTFNGGDLSKALSFYKDGEQIGGEDWVSGDDGWYYVVDENDNPKRIEAKDGEPVEVIDKLFDEVYVSEALGNKFANKEITINIEAEAVQADNIGENINATLEEVKEAFGDSEDENGRVDQYKDDKEVSEAAPLNN